MKKFTCLIAVLVIALSSSLAISSISAQVSADECDRLFAETMDGFLEDQGQGDTSFTVHKTLLYDVTLDTLGYLYTYEIEGESGYTIIVNNSGVYEVTESFFNAAPYANITGLAVYVLPFVYWEYVDEHFVDLETGVVLTDEMVESFLEDAYLGSGDGTYTEETINYDYRSETGNELSPEWPCYIGGELEGECAVIAGSNIIGYYDRYFDNLIPNFTPGFIFSFDNSYKYYLEDTEYVPAMIETLYDLMQTAEYGGTTVANFRSGLTSYINSKNLYVSYYSIMTGSSLNYNGLKSRVNSGMPFVVFLNGYNFTEITNHSEDKEDIIQKTAYSGSHAMAGFGYKEITYTLTSGAQRSDQYLAVSRGFGSRSAGYLNINSNVSFSYAWSIEIYE